MQSSVMEVLRRQSFRHARIRFHLPKRSSDIHPSPSLFGSTLRLPGDSSRLFHGSSSRWHRGSSAHSYPASSAMQCAVVDVVDHFETEDNDNLSNLAKEPQTSSRTTFDGSRWLGPSSLDLELGEETVWDEKFDDSDDAGNEEESNHHAVEPAHTKKDAPKGDAATQRRSALEMLRNFDPENPPSSNDLEGLEYWLECESYEESLLKYQSVLDDARDRKDFSSMPVFQRQVVRWFPALRDEIHRMQSDYILKTGPVTEKSAKRFGPYLCVLSPEKLAVIASHESLMACLTKAGTQGQLGVPFLVIAKRIGEAVEAEILVQKFLLKRSMEQRRRSKKKLSETADESSEDGQEGEPNGSSETINSEKRKQLTPETKNNDDNLDGAPSNWTYAASHLKQYFDELSSNSLSAKKRRVVRYAINKARKVLDKDEWTEQDRIGLGAALFQCLLQHSTVSVNGKVVPAFSYEKRWIKAPNRLHLKGIVALNEDFQKRIVVDHVGISSLVTRYKPMIVPPKLWKSAEEGGYLWLKTELMRYHGCNTQKDALGTADMSLLYRGLNALGSVPWKINHRILDVAKQCWEKEIALGDIPSRKDYELPPEPIPMAPFPPGIDVESPAYSQMMAEKQAYRDAVHKFRRIRQRNMDLNSLRCSAMLKLDQAEKFKDFEKIYFPYNVDFRGRAYPVPPNLSNVGSDLCRGLLFFAEAKPLGKRGLFWLKVQVANLAGKDKMTFEDRAGFVDANMTSVRESVEDPFAGDRWWMSLDDPFQGLAACIEIVNAIDSGDPESYMCSLPVHMDGSCNGLQHYAALGRDRIGGRAVNLCADDEPQDVYVGVMNEVIRRVAEEAERDLDFDTSDVGKLSRSQKKDLSEHRAATLVNGLIDRGVVKRTVMTSVYGVTYIGARQQIQEKIRSKLEGLGHDLDEIDNETFHACGYLAKVTMQAVGDLFIGAKETMNWLTACARMITQHGYPVAWISPIGIPAIQPYRQQKSSTITTLCQTVTITDDDDNLPIHKSRQVTAFPPNYVHSLDSSHMLLTALEMDKRGLAFSAVHDSFWTHPCDVDEMNTALRDVFVDLYRKPLLEELKNGWEMRYPDLEFPDLPKHGDLDLNEVKEAPYFFQ